jgi:hypothetical protein
MATTINNTTTGILTTPDATGNLAIQTAGVTAVTIDSNQEVTLSNTLILNTGTTTNEPLSFFSSTALLTTANVGAMEFANSQLYFTTFTGNRSVVSTPFFRRTGTNVAIANSTANQSWTGTGVTLNANTTYNFAGQFYVSTSNTGSHVEAIGFGGTATLANIFYNVQRANNANTTISNVSSNWFFSNAMTNTMPAVSQVQNVVYTLSGTVSTTAAGTFIPQWSCNIAPQLGNFYAGSYFRLEPIAQGNGNISVGTWA